METLIFMLKVTNGFISLKILLIKSFKSVYQKKSLSLWMDELTVLSYLSLYSVNEADDKIKIGSFWV